MKIALATCSELPEGDADDALVAAALAAGDNSVVWRLWDDPEVDWSDFDAVVVRSTWDYQRRRDEFLAWAARIPALHNPASVLAWNTDKRYLAELQAAGIPAIETEFVERGAFVADSATKAPHLGGAGEVVVKPTVSAGSKDTARFDLAELVEADRARELLRTIHESGRTAMVQPYVASVDDRGETALLYFDGAFSHAIRKGPLLRPGEGPTEGFFAPETIEPREPTAAERSLGDDVVGWVGERFGTLLYARVDVVEGADGEPLVLEVELTEPSLFFAHATGAAERFAGAVTDRLG
jgi:glutathione synthase/RimK-type ligase-like ATP-grasp enzyme